MLPICPCKGCTNETGRNIGCHGKCNKYIEWQKINKYYNKKQQIQMGRGIWELKNINK